MIVTHNKLAQVRSGGSILPPLEVTGPDRAVFFRASKGVSVPGEVGSFPDIGTYSFAYLGSLCVLLFSKLFLIKVVLTLVP